MCERYAGLHRQRGTRALPRRRAHLGLRSPGLRRRGRDLDEVRARLPLVVEEHLGWLRQHGVALPTPSGHHVVEEVEASDHAASGGEFCFAADRLPLPAGELEAAIPRMDFARADLLAAVTGVPDAVLDWQPDIAAMSAVDAWAPEARTIRGIVEHVLQLEAYYRTSLQDGVGEGIFSSVSDAASERQRTLDTLRSLGDGDRSRVFRPIRPSRATPEEWTVRETHPARRLARAGPHRRRSCSDAPGCCSGSRR
jgi:hypothetical protein